MRIPLILLATAVACGSAPHGSGSPPTAPPPDFAVARWIPAHPTYAFAARHVRDAQHAVVALVDSVGVLAGIRPRDVVDSSRALFGVDITSEDALASIGLDTDAGFAVFSDDVDPTLVGKLAQPSLFAEYVARQRKIGMVTSSLVVDGIEVFVARIVGELEIQWASADGWLWVHVATGAEKRDVLTNFTREGAPVLHADDVTWLARSRRGGAELPWGRIGRAALAAFLDVPGIVRRAPGVLLCTKLVLPIRGIAIAGDADATHLSARIAIDLGDDARGLASHVLAPPPGWASVADGAPLAVAWNLDIAAVGPAVQRCLDPIAYYGALQSLRGVRAARAVVQDFSGRLPIPHGAVSADLSNGAQLASLLDNIPMRARFESDRTFGPYAGHRVSVPLVISFDYVLTDRVALASNVDGLLDRAVAPAAATSQPALASVLLLPPKLSIERWRGLLELAGVAHADAIAEHLARWAKLAFAARVDGSELVVELAAERR